MIQYVHDDEQEATRQVSIYVGGEEVVFGTYPNGETLVPKLDGRTPGQLMDVWLHWESDADLVRLVLVHGAVIQALASQGRMHVSPALFIDYMPYSRMDRQQDGHCFSLKYVAEQLNALGWSSVTIVEPHSQVTLDLVENSQPLWVTKVLTPLAMSHVGFDVARDCIVLPDAGAFKRYGELMPDVLSTCNVVVLRKVRDFASGKITGIEVDHRIIRGNAGTDIGHAVIIDDLSSKGGTFVGAAEALRSLGATSVSLLVTHMEPAGLTGSLPDKLDNVFCTDTMTFPRPVPANFHVFPRSEWL